MDLFAKKSRVDVTRTQEIKSRVTEALSLTEDATVMVTELACEDEECPDVETVIAVLRPNLPKLQMKIDSAINDLSDAEIEALCRRFQEMPSA